MRRGIDFAQAEQATKIRGKYLRALEEERFELLPSETYVKGFLRTYADYLGLDGQLYVDEYNSRFVAGRARARARGARGPRRRTRNRRSRRIVVLAVLAAIAVVTVVVISAWKSSGGDHPPSPPHEDASAGSSAPQPPAPYLVAASGSAARRRSRSARSGPTGAVVFQGTVEKGETLPFAGKRFWLNVEHARAPRDHGRRQARSRSPAGSRG